MIMQEQKLRFCTQLFLTPYSIQTSYILLIFYRCYKSDAKLTSVFYHFMIKIFNHGMSHSGIQTWPLIIRFIDSTFYHILQESRRSIRSISRWLGCIVARCIVATLVACDTFPRLEIKSLALLCTSTTLSVPATRENRSISLFKSRRYTRRETQRAKRATCSVWSFKILFKIPRDLLRCDLVKRARLLREY